MKNDIHEEIDRRLTEGVRTCKDKKDYNNLAERICDEFDVSIMYVISFFKKNNIIVNPPVGNSIK